MKHSSHSTLSSPAFGANQAILVAMLESLEQRVVVVGDGAAAVQMLSEQEFDLVFMDLRMPVLGGLGAASRAREAEAKSGARRVPIVALTANTQSVSLEETRQAGIDAMIAKPVSLKDLTKVIVQWIGPPSVPDSEG